MIECKSYANKIITLKNNKLTIIVNIATYSL
jgi:hypothetical protein